MIQFDEHFFQRGWKQPPTTRKNHPPTETEDTSIFDLPGILWRHNSTDPPAYIYLIEQATDGRGAWPMWNNQSSHIFSKLPHNPTPAPPKKRVPETTKIAAGNHFGVGSDEWNFLGPKGLVGMAQCFGLDLW